MSFDKYNQKLKTLLQQKDSDLPLVPIDNEPVDSKTILGLIKYWSDLVWKDKEKTTLSCEFYFYSYNHCTNHNFAPNDFKKLDNKFFTDLTETLFNNLKVLSETEQFLAFTKQLSNVKTCPLEGIFHDDPPEVGNKDRYNFNARNFDRFQITRLNTLEKLRVLAEFINVNPFTNLEESWYFVSSFGIFGWIKREEIFEKEPVESIQAFITEPLLEIVENGDALTVQSTKKLLHPLGFAFGAELELMYDQDYYSFIEYNNVLRKLIIPDKYIHIGIKTPNSDSLIADYKSLLGQPYAWGGNTLFDEQRNEYLFGHDDCSGIIRKVLRMYGLKLPNNGSGQNKVGDVILKKDDRYLEQSEVQSWLDNNNYTPGLTFLNSKGHIVIVISKAQEPLEVLHAQFHPRMYKNGDQEIFYTQDYHWTDLDKVVITDFLRLDKNLFPNIEPQADHYFKPYLLWQFKF